MNYLIPMTDMCSPLLWLPTRTTSLPTISRTFPWKKLGRYSLTAIHPDVFLCRMLDWDTRGVLDVMDTVVSNKTNPPRTMGEELAHLRKLRLNTFSDRLKSLYSE